MQKTPKKSFYVGITNNADSREKHHRHGGRLRGSEQFIILHRNLTYGQARGSEQFLIEKGNKTGVVGTKLLDLDKYHHPKKRGNKINSYDRNSKTRDPARRKYFEDAYNEKREMSQTK